VVIGHLAETDGVYVISRHPGKAEAREFFAGVIEDRPLYTAQGRAIDTAYLAHSTDAEDVGGYVATERQGPEHAAPAGTILYRFDDHGGLLVGDPATGLAAYAHPTSQMVHNAKEDLAGAARTMLARAGRLDAVGDEGPDARAIRETRALHIAHLEEGRADGSTKEIAAPLAAALGAVAEAEDGPCLCHLNDDEDIFAGLLADAPADPALAQLLQTVGESAPADSVDWPAQPDTYHGQREDRQNDGRATEPFERLLERA
jgi:hypothetical protein